jgi:hypothetical protein
MKVAENLLLLALADPNDRWSPQLEYALTAGFSLTWRPRVESTSMKPEHYESSIQLPRTFLLTMWC